MTKWIIPLITLAFACMILMTVHESLAESRDMASKTVVCKYKDIKRSGGTQYEARDKVANACFDTYLNHFERTRGGMPDDEQSMMLIESCVNDTTCS